MLLAFKVAVLVISFRLACVLAVIRGSDHSERYRFRSKDDPRTRKRSSPRLLLRCACILKHTVLEH